MRTSPTSRTGRRDGGAGGARVIAVWLALLPALVLLVACGHDSSIEQPHEVTAVRVTPAPPDYRPPPSVVLSGARHPGAHCYHDLMTATFVYLATRSACVTQGTTVSVRLPDDFQGRACSYATSVEPVENASRAPVLGPVSFGSGLFDVEVSASHRGTFDLLFSPVLCDPSPVPNPAPGSAVIGAAVLRLQVT